MDDFDGLRDRYRGALVASACGDALGATVEFMSRDEIRERYGVLRDIVGGGWLRLPRGEVTDDTQMALCIAHSIVDCGRFAPADVAERFVTWYQSNPPDIGNTTRRSLEHLAAGVSWHEAGQRTHERMRPRDASNGSVMRCAPVALYARTDPEANARYSAESSIITHSNPLSADSCVAMNAGLAAWLNDPGANALETAIEATGNAEVQRCLEEAPEMTPAELKAGGFVLSTLQASFWAVTAHDTLEGAIIAAVNLGEDTDTTGAVTGALAGARWGVSAIPNRWLDVLVPHDEIVDLADRLLEMSLRRR